MPLSEHEERILAQIERQLAAEDPKFVARTRQRRRFPVRRQRRLAAFLGIVGVFGILLLGFLTAPWNLVSGVVGFALVFAAILLAATASDTDRERPSVGVPPDDRA